MKKRKQNKNQLGFQLWDQLGFQLWDQLGVQLRDQLRGQLGYQFLDYNLWELYGRELKFKLFDLITECDEKA